MPWPEIIIEFELPMVELSLLLAARAVNPVLCAIIAGTICYALLMN